jgi:hypothetical protein
MNFIFSKQGFLLVAIGVTCAAACQAQVIELGEPIAIEQPKTLSSEANSSSTVASRSLSYVESTDSIVAPKSAGSLVIRNSERLMPALKKWLADQNIELVWAANATTPGRIRDVVFEDDFESSSADITIALTEALSPFGFEAEISNGASVRRVTVRNLRNTM